MSGSAWRFGFGAVACLAVVVVVLAAAAATGLDAAAEAAADSALRLSLVNARARLARVAQTIDADLDGVAGRLAAREGPLARAAGSHGIVEPGELGLVPRSLGAVDVLDDAGTLLASTYWPERAGLRVPELLTVESGPVGWTLISTLAGEVPALLSRRVVQVAGRRFHVVGGTLVDAPLLESLGEGVVTWVSMGGVPVARGGEGASRIDASIVVLEGRAAEAAQRIRDREGRQWIALATSSGRGGGVRLVQALDPAPYRRMARQRTRSLLLLAGALFALGAMALGFLARRSTRPYHVLAGAVRAVASGKADYAYAGSDRGGVESVAATVSELSRSLEVQRRRARTAERVAAWREIARRVAHEVKNPLAPIRLTVENLRRARRQVPERFEELFEDGTRTILEEVDQLSHLVGEFSEFARMPAPRPRAVPLRQLLDGVAELFDGSSGPRVVRHYAEDLPLVHVDPDQLGRALKNVVGNAVEACAGAGRGVEVEIHAEPVDGGVRVEVWDRGPGFAEADLERVFEPYFTTKAQGTGLGLAIAYRIVTEHGGTIAARNREGGGAAVALELPVTTVAPGAAAPRTRGRPA